MAVTPTRPVEELESVVIRFAGDSGDGMQLAGDEFSQSIAESGHDFATHPDYPSEIRAPVGTLFGVSGYQVQFSSHEVFTSGDAADVLVAMNPAALKVNLPDVKYGGMIIVNTGAFTAANLAKAGYTSSPLDDDSLAHYRVVPIDVSGLTANALRDSGLSRKEVGRCKNYFALGLMLWLYHRPLEAEVADIERKFAKAPALAAANIAALRAGHLHGDNAELFPVTYDVKPAPIAPGTYRSVTGNQATALGLVAASERSGLPLFLGSYPITPASDILHTLASLRHFQVTTFQAEDEIAGICSAIGASYGGALGVTTTSGPGMALKTEALGLAVMTELPLVVVNVQRGGPSTGLPTKIEQADLLQAVHGRNGECPVPVLAARSPADCFDCALEAVRLATRYMTPVILLSDGGIANSSEPWRIPEPGMLPDLTVRFRTDPHNFHAYDRDEHLARAWVRPGTPGLEHRIGGLEKDAVTGNLSGDPRNHQRMVETRAAKVAGIAHDLPPLAVHGSPSGELLVVAWGSTWGAVAQAVEQVAARGLAVGHVHLRHLNPFPPDLGDLLRRYRRVLVPELNLGQLASLLRARYLVDVVSFGKVQGRPFRVAELVERIEELAR
ncbi:MAG: 2-oxoacid:acceptor oxidoreductase subunit alpha [Gemmatimonadales bacterium]|jgi:2-oxoglutarate ferredoxin oxidoreductase subunit alpha|nr:2-oxoacid:acceptor oxidoreductase subunit alpha [Gemmatimonadales bacterium]